MDVKLTLRLDHGIIERAKEYAWKNKTSLSRMVENFFRNLETGNQEREGISVLIQKISGIIELPEDHDHIEEYAEFLKNKYSR